MTILALARSHTPARLDAPMFDFAAARMVSTCATSSDDAVAIC
jgi:hypothetical protein